MQNFRGFVVLITRTYYLMTTSLTATREHHQHRKSDMSNLHFWNKSMVTGVRAVVKKNLKIIFGV